MVTLVNTLPRVSRALDAHARAIRAIVALGVAVIAASGGLLAERRFAGALQADLPWSSLAPTAALAAAIVFAGRVVWRRSLNDASSAPGRFAELAFAWGGSISLVLLAVGCSDFGRTRDWLLWLPLVAADQLHRHWFLHGVWFPGAAPKRREPVIGLYDPGVSANGSAATIDADGQVLQQLVRVRDGAGGESVRGTLYAEFAAGQRTATLHVGFCPPLERLPRVEVSPCDLPPAEVKVVQALAHGARLEVRLSQPTAKPCSVTIDFSATPVASADGTRMNADLADKRG